MDAAATETGLRLKHKGCSYPLRGYILVELKSIHVFIVHYSF